MKLMERMELAVNPKPFFEQWPCHQEPVNKPNGVWWYCAPKPYRYGFITSPTENGAKEQRRAVLKSIVDSVKTIPWG